MDIQKNTGKKSANKLLFQEQAIIHVTNLDIDPPAAPYEFYETGYLCGGIVSIFSDGTIVTVDDSGEDTEKLLISDLLLLKTNINNYDPSFTLEICFVTDRKEIGVNFRTRKAKTECKKVLMDLLDNQESS